VTAREQLSGGFVSSVIRDGDTVRRGAGSPNATFVHQLLRHLDEVGWHGAPRFHGLDEDGAEILDFIPGQSGAEPAVRARVGEDVALTELTRMVRRLHDLTAGTALAGGQEVVCHHDLDPRNTIYRDDDGRLRPVALIDWDIAGPGRRVQDVARIAWQFLPLAPEVSDVNDTARRLRLIVDEYRLEEPEELVPTVLWWQERCWRGIEAGAEVGEPAMVALRNAGVVTGVRSAEEWTREHQSTLAAALR
jgi:aminoglycoside phosphotransferase